MPVPILCCWTSTETEDRNGCSNDNLFWALLSLECSMSPEVIATFIRWAADVFYDCCVEDPAARAVIAQLWAFDEFNSVCLDSTTLLETTAVWRHCCSSLTVFFISSISSCIARMARTSKRLNLPTQTLWYRERIQNRSPLQQAKAVWRHKSWLTGEKRTDAVTRDGRDSNTAVYGWLVHDKTGHWTQKGKRQRIFSGPVGGQHQRMVAHWRCHWIRENPVLR